jgi:hypothetical protein
VLLLPGRSPIVIEMGRRLTGSPITAVLLADLGLGVLVGLAVAMLMNRGLLLGFAGDT